MIRKATCKCGRLIIANDERRVVSHEAPECEFFKTLLRQAGPSERSIEMLDTESGAPVGAKGGDT